MAGDWAQEWLAAAEGERHSAPGAGTSHRCVAWVVAATAVKIASSSMPAALVGKPAACSRGQGPGAEWAHTKAVGMGYIVSKPHI